jgi:hypothetical protein
MKNETLVENLKWDYIIKKRPEIALWKNNAGHWNPDYGYRSNHINTFKQYNQDNNFKIFI